MIITGTIENIEYRNVNGKEKKVVTILPDHRQRAFVEFRHSKMDMLYGYKENDDIAVEVIFEGKISNNSGIQFNNLVAQSIKNLSNG